VEEGEGPRPFLPALPSLAEPCQAAPCLACYALPRPALPAVPYRAMPCLATPSLA